MTYLLTSQKDEIPVEPTSPFEGSSTELTLTAIMPTLDTPLPENKSAIWCLSFQMAWNELQTLLKKEPIRLANASETVRRLNEARFSRDSLVPEMYYSTAGFMRDGIGSRIHEEMKRSFPSVKVPSFGVEDAIIAYAYLEAQIGFNLPYFEDHLLFADTEGKETKVRAFGIRNQDFNGMRQLRDQAELLFAMGQFEQLTEFGIDLCKLSEPHQIVVAMVQKKGSLADTFAYVQDRIKDSQNRPAHDRRLGMGDRLLVPTMNWKIDHRFSDLERVPLQNDSAKGLYIDQAFQTIRFRLDKGGADLKSDAGIRAKSESRMYHFDRPYLLYMKKRGSNEPFLVMWVDNAELMIK